MSKFKIAWQDWGAIVAIIIALGTCVFAYGYEKSQNETTREAVIKLEAKMDLMQSTIWNMNEKLCNIEGKINK